MSDDFLQSLRNIVIGHSCIGENIHRQIIKGDTFGSPRSLVVSTRHIVEQVVRFKGRGLILNGRRIAQVQVCGIHPLGFAVHRSTVTNLQRLTVLEILPNALRVVGVVVFVEIRHAHRQLVIRQARRYGVYIHRVIGGENILRIEYLHQAEYHTTYSQPAVWFVHRKELEPHPVALLNVVLGINELQAVGCGNELNHLFVAEVCRHANLFGVILDEGVGHAHKLTRLAERYLNGRNGAEHAICVRHDRAYETICKVVRFGQNQSIATNREEILLEGDVVTLVLLIEHAGGKCRFLPLGDRGVCFDPTINHFEPRLKLRGRANNLIHGLFVGVRYHFHSCSPHSPTSMMLALHSK